MRVTRAAHSIARPRFLGEAEGRTNASCLKQVVGECRKRRKLVWAPRVGSTELTSYSEWNPLLSTQVKTDRTLLSSPACMDSSVQVGCLAADRLGVNVTWKSRLEDIPVASLPDLRDIGMFFCTAASKPRGRSE